MANRLARTLGTAAPAASPAFATALATARATAPLAAAFALALAIPLSGCASPPQTPSPGAEREGTLVVRDREAPTDAAPAEAAIDADAAARAAIDYAGLAEQDVAELRVELDSERDAPAYEVGFRVGETAYGYDVDAATGEVLGFEVAADA